MKKIKPKYPRLNLGSGNEYRQNWVNIDVDPKWKSDILWDIEKGIPLEDSSIEEVFIKHVLEHIDPRKFSFVMSELARVCKNNAKIIIYCPYFSCSITYKTIDHISAISYYTFDKIPQTKLVCKRLYFFRKSFGYSNWAVNFLVKILNPIFSFLPNIFPLIYERFLCWICPVEEIKVTLKVKK